MIQHTKPKKIDLKTLVSIRKNVIPKVMSALFNAKYPYFPMLVDWDEFDVVYRSNRPVVIECPKERLDDFGSCTISFICAMRMAYGGRRPNIDERYNSYISFLTEHLFNELVASKYRGCGCIYSRETDRVFKLWDGTPLRPKLDDLYYFRGTNDYLQNANVGETSFDLFCGINDLLDSDVNDFGERLTFVGIFPSGDEYQILREFYKDKMIFIDYTPEKRLVNEFYVREGTFLDPTFDIELLGNKFDHRRLFTYMATNYRNEFKEYMTLNNDIVEKRFAKVRINELI